MTVRYLHIPTELSNLPGHLSRVDGSRQIRFSQEQTIFRGNIWLRFVTFILDRSLLEVAKSLIVPGTVVLSYRNISAKEKL